MTTSKQLKRALHPEQIAVIGASDRALSRGSYIWRSLCLSPMGAHAWPVNPKYKYIGERRCYASVCEIPSPIDLAVIALRADRVPQALEECARKGVGGVLVATEEAAYASDRAWLEEVEKKAETLGLTLIGPDSLGILVPHMGLNASFWPGIPRPGNIALLCQSGLIASSLLDYAEEAELGFSGVISTGAELDVDMADLVDYYADDANTRVIAIEIEGLKNPRAFFSAVHAAAASKSVVILKAGDGSGFAADRLASFRYINDAGADRAFASLSERSGAQRVKSFESFTAAVSALATNRLPRGNRLALISNDSGFAALCADAAHGLDVDLHGLSNETIHELEKAHPSAQVPVNPIVVGATASSKRFQTTLDIVLRDPMIDGAIVIVAPGPVSMIDPTLKYLAKTASGATKPVVTAWVSDRITRSVRSQLRLVPNAPISAIQSPTGAVEGFAALAHRIRMRNDRILPEDPWTPSFDREKLAELRSLLDGARRGGRYNLAAHEIAPLFELLDVDLLPRKVARTPAEAIEKAAETGWPVSLKVWAEGLNNKTRAGGIRHDIADPSELLEAWRAIRANLEEYSPMTPFRGMTVHPTVEHPLTRTLHIASTYDNVLGPVVECGPSDKLVDLPHDVAVEAPPIAMTRARRMLDSPALKHWLESGPGLPAVDRTRLCRLLCSVSLLATLIPAVRRLSIDPIVWTEDGPLAVDAVLHLSGGALEPDADFSHLAIRPWNEEDREVMDLGGVKAVLRELRPSDYEALRGFVASLSERSRYMRFHTRAHITDERVMELSRIDYDREQAWVLELEDGTIAATARWSRSTEPDEAEFGIAVADAWQRHGIASRLMAVLEKNAVDRHMKRLVGFVLRGNEGMQALSAKLGFEKNPHRETRDTDAWEKTIA